MKHKEYFTTKYDNGGIYRENKYGRLRLSGKPKILLKEIFNIRKNDYGETDEVALDTAKQIFEFLLKAFENIGNKVDDNLGIPLSPFVFYPNKKKNLEKILHDLNNKGK